MSLNNELYRQLLKTNVKLMALIMEEKMQVRLCMPPSPSSELDLKQPFKWTLIYGPTTSVAFIAETIFGGIIVAPTLLKIEPWSNVYVRWMDRTRSSDRTEKGERKNETLFGAWTMGKIELSSLLSLGSPTHVTDAKQEQFFSR